MMFDTNVWIAIEGLGPNFRKDFQADYSFLLKDAKEKGRELVTNDYVLAEFQNRYARLLLSEYCATHQISEQPNFKQFRSSEEFQPCMQQVREVCFSILDDCTFMNVFSHTDMKMVLDEVTKGCIDFSDVLLREHCLHEDLILVSSDYDYLGCGLDIISANRRILESFHGKNKA